MPHKKSPNILFIMADSLAPHFLGAYGDPIGATPHIDRLARCGVTFDRAYCNSPLCAPSRASMVTGRYVGDLGAFDNAGDFSADWPTFGHVLGARGYETAIIGKMHFLGHDQYHGFHQRLALETDYSWKYDPKKFRMAYNWTQPSGPNPMGLDWMAPSYLQSDDWKEYRFHYNHDETIHQQALRYLKARDSAFPPFFACISYHAPHNPFWIPEADSARFDRNDLPIPPIPSYNPDLGPMDRWLNDFHGSDAEFRTRFFDPENLRWLYKTFYGVVSDLDRRIGEILACCEDQGLLENTAVFFTSDHGDMMGHRGMIQKRCFYERSMRIPWIGVFPGRWHEGMRIKTPVSLIDLFPTISDMIAGEAPADLPGTSLLPSLERGEEPPERTIYGEYHGEGVHAPCYMAVYGRYKYIYVHQHEERLYDLATDPDESRNLCTDQEHVEVLQKMRDALLTQFAPEQTSHFALQFQRNRQYIYRNRSLPTMCDRATGQNSI